MHVVPDDSACQQEIDDLGIPAPPEWRAYHDAERRLVRRPDTVVVRGLHTEDIGAGRQVRVGGLVLVTHVVPSIVEPFHHIGILVLPR